MGVVIDTGVFILWERSGRTLDFNQWGGLGNAQISAITASELLMGVHRANGPQRRMDRSGECDDRRSLRRSCFDCRSWRLIWVLRGFIPIRWRN